jgi:hypothetical protein
LIALVRPYATIAFFLLFRPALLSAALDPAAGTEMKPFTGRLNYLLTLKTEM